MKRPLKHTSLAILFLAFLSAVNWGQASWGQEKPIFKPGKFSKSKFAKGSKVSQEPAAAPANQPSGWVSVVYSKDYLISLAGLERLHSFDIRKYKKIHDQLVKEKLLTAKHTLRPQPISTADILLVQSQSFLDRLKDKEQVATFLEAPPVGYVPALMIDAAILKPFRHATGGTLLAARKALEHGIAVNIGGGYHHAKIDRGEGFCIYADVPIAIRKLQKEKKIQRALVIDVDVHQGNGTAVCLSGDDSTYTFSMHQGDIYPIPKETSDWDIELEAGTNDEAFMALLEPALPKLFERAKPDIVFIVAGCDTLDGDPLAELAMTEDGIVRRDMAIIKACADRKVPVVFTLSGGYSPNAWHAQYLSVKAIIETYGLAKNAGE